MVSRIYTMNSAQQSQSLMYLAQGFAVGQICESSIYYSGHASESGGRFTIAEIRSSAYTGTVGTFSSDGHLEGLYYRFSPILDSGKIDIRKLGVQCETGVTGWHSRLQNIVTWARTARVILTGEGTLSCTETVSLEGVFFEGDLLEFQAGTAQDSTGDAGATFFTPSFTNNAVTFTTGTPVVVNFTAHGLSVNDPFKFGVSNGGRLPGSLAWNTTYYVKEVLTANTFTISSSVGGSALAATTAGTGTFYLFQCNTSVSGIETVDDIEYSGRIVRKGIVVKAGPGTTYGAKIRDNLTQRVRVRGDGNFDFTTLSSCIGIMHVGDRGPHGKYDYSANYCYAAVGTNTENEKHKVIVRGVYVVHLLKMYVPTSGTNDSMDWELSASNYIFGLQEAEGLDSWQRYTIRLEPRLDPASYAKVSAITGDDAPCFLLRNGKASALSGIMRGHNGINCFFISGRTNTTGTSNRAWADTVFFDNLHVIHGYGTFLNIQNCRKVAGQIFLKDWGDPNGAGQSPAAAFKIGRVSNAAGLRVFGANIRNTVGLEVGDATYYSRDAHLGHWAIEMGDLVQFNTGAQEQTGGAGNPTTLDAVNLVKMKNCVIDLTGMRGNLDIGPDVIEDSTIILDKNALLYTITVDPSAVCSYGYNSLLSTGLVESQTTYPPVIIETSSQAYEPNSGSITIDAPADVETGDYLLLLVGCDYTDSSTATITPPSGFTSLAAYTRTNTGAEGVAMQAFYKVATSEPATYTITETALQKFAAVMVRISGVDSDYPVDVQAIGSNHATEPSVPAVTTTVDDTISVAAVTWDGSKTLTSGPSGYTAIQHVDQTGLDVYVAQKSNSVAGDISASPVDLSASDDWVGFHFVFRKQGATSGSGASNVGPFPLSDDGLGYTTKLTLPVNEAGALSNARDAYELFTSNSPNYDAGQPILENYTHPIYFLRTATYYQMASPIRPGAYTGSNINGPARCEFRHERNYSPTERIRFKVTFELVQAAANSKCTCVQIHRSSGSPVIKGVIQVDSGGTTFKFRTLVKKYDGGSDEQLDKNAQDTNAKTGLAFNVDHTVEYDWTPGGDLKIWVNTPNSNTPDRWYENVLSSDLTSYIKPGGPYPSNAGDGADTDLWIVRVKNFVLIDDDGNEITRS